MEAILYFHPTNVFELAMSYILMRYFTSRGS